MPGSDFTIHDQSPLLSHDPSPPCVRFPTGGILGSHFIVAGTYLGQTSQYFSIWALDLHTMTWSPINPGKDITAGSWFQSSLWSEANKLIMFGNKHGSIADDYSQRVSSWEHVAIIDLESYGIYQPPPLDLDISMQELSLTAFEESVGCDYEVMCDDGRKIKCSRKLLEARWPWFESQLTLLLEKAKMALEVAPTPSPPTSRKKDLSSDENRPDPRVSSRVFKLGEPYPVVMALLQYFYTLALPTPLQQAPAVLSQLLVISTSFKISRLQALVKHAMHLALSESTCDGVYEVATLCGCRSLQIR